MKNKLNYDQALHGYDFIQDTISDLRTKRSKLIDRLCYVNESSSDYPKEKEDIIATVYLLGCTIEGLNKILFNDACEGRNIPRGGI